MPPSTTFLDIVSQSHNPPSHSQTNPDNPQFQAILQLPPNYLTTLNTQQYEQHAQDFQIFKQNHPNLNPNNFHVSNQEEFNLLITFLAFQPINNLYLHLSQTFTLTQNITYQLYDINFLSIIAEDHIYLYPNIHIPELKHLNLTNFRCFNIPQLPQTLETLETTQYSDRILDLSLHNLPNLNTLIWNSSPIDLFQEIQHCFNHSNITNFTYNGPYHPELTDISLPYNIVSWNGWGFNEEIPFRQSLEELIVIPGYYNSNLHDDYFFYGMLDVYSGPYIEIPGRIKSLKFYDSGVYNFKDLDRLEDLELPIESLALNVPKSLTSYIGAIFNNGDLSKFENLNNLKLLSNDHLKIFGLPERLYNLEISSDSAEINVQKFIIDNIFKFDGLNLNFNCEEFALGLIIDVRVSRILFNNKDYKLDIYNSIDVSGTVYNLNLDLDKDYLDSLTLFQVSGKLDLTKIKKISNLTLFCSDNVKLYCNSISRLNVSIEDSSENHEITLKLKSSNIPNIVADEGVEIIF